MQRAKGALKGLSLGWSGYPVWEGGLWPSGGFSLPGSSYDYEGAVGDPTKNGVASICLNWIADQLVEPRLRVCRVGDGGSREPVKRHPLVELFNRPNGDYSGVSLLQATAISYQAFGNGYWLVWRGAGGLGKPKQLWYEPQYSIWPDWPQDGSQFISRYVREVSGRRYGLRKEDVVQFRFGLDPANLRSGVARLYPVLRELATDNELSTWIAALARNCGVVPWSISPADKDTELNEPDREAIRREFRARFTGEGRADVMVSSAGLKVDRLSLSPAEMAVEALQRLPILKICAALRIAPMVVNLDLEKQRPLKGVYHEARRAAYQDCILPMLATIAMQVQWSLGPDLLGPDEEVDFDFSRVPALAEELAETYRQVTMSVRGGWATVNEGRGRAGLPHAAGQDIFLRGGAGSPGDGTTLPQTSDGSTSEVKPK